MQYQFPVEKLATPDQDDSRQPVILVACGSFSPITYLHLRIFEMAKDRIAESNRFILIGGYFSPVSDAYNKQGLAEGKDRVAMCNLAVQDSSWVMVDDWEAYQKEYQRTVVVLDHFKQAMNEWCHKMSFKSNVRVMMLAGGDLIESFGVAGLWSDEDLEKILGEYGVLIVERTGVDVKGFLLSHDIAYKHRNHILIAKQYIYNDISSTLIRLFIKRDLSVKYLLPDSVIDYISSHGLYK